MANTIKIGSTEIDNVLLGSTQVEKVYIGSDLVWENWVLNTGSLFEMTSATTPSPFVVSTNSGYPTNRWRFFNSSTDIWDPTTVSSVYDRIDLVNPVRLAEFQIKINYGAYGNATFYLEASNDGTTFTELWNSGSIGVTLNRTVTLDSLIGYRYYQVRMSAPSGTYWTWEKFVITKWYTK